MYTRTTNPWLLAAGAGGGLANVYGEAMTRIAQIRAQQEHQARQNQVAQQMFGYKQQQDVVDNAFREKQLTQQRDYQTGMLRNAADRNDVMSENALLRALFMGSGGSTKLTNPGDVPTSYMNNASNIERDSIAAARTQLPRVPTGDMPVQVRPAAGMAQAPQILQALSQATQNPDIAMSLVKGMWNQQPQPNVTPGMPGASWWNKDQPPQTNSWNSATVNTNAVLEALAKSPALMQLFAQSGLPTNAVSSTPMTNNIDALVNKYRSR